MKGRTNELSENEMELVKILMSNCKSTGDVQNTLKRLFAGTIEQKNYAEHTIRFVKRFHILSERYRNRRIRFSLRFSLLSGICNFDMST